MPSDAFGQPDSAGDSAMNALHRIQSTWARLAIYLCDIWQCRYFWVSLVILDIKMRYRRSLLGIGWSLLHPIAMTTVICFVWKHLWGHTIRDFAPSLMGGLIYWHYITACTKDGCRCFIRGEAYIRQCPVPVAIYPLRVVLGAAFHYLIALTVVVLLTWGFQGFNNLSSLPLIIPAFLLLLLFGWSMCVLTGVANLYFPDTGHITVIILQILFYGTPIIYMPDRLRDQGLGWIIDCNPFAAILECIRVPILNGHPPSTLAAAVAATTVLTAFGAAGALLARVKDRIIFRL